MDLDNPFDLLGLLQVGGLPFRAGSAPLHMPDMTTMRRRSAPSLSMCWSKRSGIISGCPTTTWRRSRMRSDENGGDYLPCERCAESALEGAGFGG
jgi:hypothetical protein